MKRRKKKSSPVLRVLLWGTLLLMFCAGGAALYGYFWVQNYLKSPAFREMLASQVGGATQSEAALADLNWSGPSMYVSRVGLSPKARQGWKLIEGEGLQATVNFQATRRGLWQVTRITLDRLSMNLRSVAEIPQNLPPDTEFETAPPAVPGWLKAWLPTRTQIDTVEVESFDLVPSEPGGVSISGLQLNAKPGVDEGAWLLRGRDGTLKIPGVGDAFEISTASARLDTRSLTLNDCVARWTGESEVSARGDLPFETGKPWSFTGRLSSLDLKYVLGAEWTYKLTGVLSSDFTAKPDSLEGKMTVRNGIIQNLPLLERVADFTRTERFRRVVLDEATADVECQGETTHIRNLVLQSNGLVRVQGDVVIQGRALQSRLMVGVLPETLRWIPGSQSRVFTENNPNGPPGFVWTHVNLSGTLDSIREDLTDRLLVAMGKAALDVPLDLAGKSLDVLGNAAPAGPVKEVIRTGQEVLGGKLPEKAVESGLDILKGAVPIFGR